MARLDPKDYAFCCLGVLANECELFQESWEAPGEATHHGVVTTMANLASSGHSMSFPYQQQDILACVNDAGATFEAIVILLGACRKQGNTVRGLVKTIENMNDDIYERWISALSSGDYRQAPEQLATNLQHLNSEEEVA